MKKILFALWALTASTAFAQNAVVTFKGFQGQKVEIYNMEDMRNPYTHEAKAATSTFKPELNTPSGMFVRIENEEGTQNSAFFVSDNTPVTVTQKEGKITVSGGSKLNKLFLECTDKFKKLNEDYKKIVKDYQDGQEKLKEASEDEKAKFAGNIQMRIEENEKAYKTIYQQVLEETKETLIPCFFQREAIQYVGLDYLEEYLKTYKFTDRPSIQNTLKQIAAEKVKAPGSKVIDFVMNDLNDKPVHLTDWVGKGNYVLVDFWASWCGPCRAEMPNVKAAYEKYHSKGFEVVGVSLDRDKKAWETGVKNLGITWPQMSDLKYWNSEGAAIYNIRSIPATILFDPEGKVVTTNLRGEDLENKLKEIYGE